MRHQKYSRRTPHVREKLESTYRFHRQGLFTVALSVTGCRQLAEDAIQSAFERLCRMTTAPDGDMVSYVYASVRNAARDALRADRRAARNRESIFNGFVPPTADVSAPDDQILTAERDQILRKAVHEMDEADREIVVLKAFAGLTFDAIGTILEEPAKTAATRYRRALMKLQEKLRGQL